MKETWTRPDPASIKAAYDRLFYSSLSLSKIKDAALEGRLLGTGACVAGRSIAWKLFLLSPEQPLQTPTTSTIHVDLWLELCRSSRQTYKTLLLQKMRAPDGSYEEGLIIPGLSSSPPRTNATTANLSTNNPLSLDVENPWKEWFAAIDLRRTIRQDVERTFPDIAYFRDPDVQAHLTNVLYLWSAMNTQIGYRQGMHEILAMLYIALDYDSLEEHTVDGVLAQLCSRGWVAADAWSLFDSVMHAIGRWYEWREPSQPMASASPSKTHASLSLDKGQVAQTSYVSPIIQACNEVQFKFLKATDPELWRSLQAAGIEPQIYGIRWLRLLFTRELSMPESMMIWDGLFACDPHIHLAKWICVAMLIRIRNQLIPSDYSEQLTYLLRYPALSSLDSEEPGAIPSSVLLLRQALRLQLSPSPATGTSVMVENRNLLHIPTEVPERPPPPTRRPGRAPAPAPGPSIERNSLRPFHVKQLSAHAQSMGLPDLARNILDRGETLGINKASFFSAVSELRRNLPDIAASAASLMKSPPADSSPGFPLLNERASQDSLPRGSQSRQLVEQEIDGIRALQRRLGHSVGWIVDALLQSEDGDYDEGHVKAIRSRKQDALESLAYVRDVLQGHVAIIDEDRLWDEAELQRRRAQATLASSSTTSLGSLPSVAAAEALSGRAPVSPTKSVAASSNRSRPFMPRFEPAVAPPLSPSPPPFAPASPSVPSSDAESTPLVSWKQMMPDFSAPVPSITQPLPRSSIPPRSPPIISPRGPLQPVPVPEVAKASAAGGSKQGLDYDPLGALH